MLRIIKRFQSNINTSYKQLYELGRLGKFDKSPLNSEILFSTNENIIHMRDTYLSPTFKTFKSQEHPIVLKKGKMQYVWDNYNKRYIDLVAQNICVSVGHCHPKIVDATIEQMQEMAHCSSAFYHEKPALLAKKLIEKIPPHPSGDDWVVHLVNNGSEAVDLAVQMAKVYTNRPEIIALYKGYHGLQGYAAGLTAIGKSTQSCYSSMFPSIYHVEPNDIKQLKNILKYTTHGKIGGIIIEPLQGYGGVFPLEKNYMKKAFHFVKKCGGVSIADEVQTGYGRCGESFWGFQMKHNDVIPDIITTAKGMGNGVGIIGAVICRRSIAEAFTSKMFFNTYSCNPTACAAALSVLDVIEEEKIIENCLIQGNYFKEKINELCITYPQIYKEIRGHGLFLGLEVNGKNINESLKNIEILQTKVVEKGVLIGSGSAVGNVFRIQPPMCIESLDIDYVVDVLKNEAERLIKEKNL